MMPIEEHGKIDKMIAMAGGVAGGVEVTCGGVTVNALADTAIEHLGARAHAASLVSHKLVAVRAGALPAALPGAAIVVGAVAGRIIDLDLHDEGRVLVIEYATPMPIPEDETPPDAVVDLRFSDNSTLKTAPDVLMKCTASGDDGMAGLADEFSVRWRPYPGTPIATDPEWDAAGILDIGQGPGPWFANSIPGGTEHLFASMVFPVGVTGIYIAIRYRDENGNVGGISNSIVWVFE